MAWKGHSSIAKLFTIEFGHMLGFFFPANSTLEVFRKWPQSPFTEIRLLPFQVPMWVTHIRRYINYWVRFVCVYVCTHMLTYVRETEWNREIQSRERQQRMKTRKVKKKNGPFAFPNSINLWNLRNIHHLHPWMFNGEDWNVSCLSFAGEDISLLSKLPAVLRAQGEIW